MDEFEDLDGLLDMETDLQLGPSSIKKRDLADRSSQEETETLLGSSAKRAKDDALPIDDNELLEIAARIPFSQSQNPHVINTSHLDEELQRLAAGSQPSQHCALPAKKPGAGALRQQPQGVVLNEDETIDIDAALELEETTGVPETGGASAPGLAAGHTGEAMPTMRSRQTLDSIIPPREYIPPQIHAINISGNFITVTSEYGERVYVQVTSAEKALIAGSRVDIAGALCRAQGGLLSCGIDKLMEEVEKDQFERALAETAEGSDVTESNRNPDLPLPSPPPPSPTKEGSASAPKGDAALWVDRYAPKSFMDLLSDEQINRDVVRWLKLWDPVVFGRPAPAERRPQGTTTTAFGEGGERGAYAYSSTRYRKRHAGDATGSTPGMDELNRPEHKVILLSGPPGLGKTTLAHVVARHCGYRPVEINASDDRSGSALLSRVIDAAEMRSVIGEKRPNCIIIDEIDGAVGGTEGRSSINALLKLIAASPRGKIEAGASMISISGGNRMDTKAGESDHAAGVEEDSDHDDDNAADPKGGASKGRLVAGSSHTKKRRQTIRPLMRPIICICNDLYAPALRPLREVARVFRFRQPSAEHLAHRLQMVCAAEGLRAEKSTLRMLAERAECDVRSCMNTLQFLAKRQRLVRHRDVTGLGMGQKDMTKGAFQVWGELLQIKKAPSIIGRVTETESQRTLRLFDTLMDFGEPDLVLAGVHESLPQLRFFDMAMQRTSQVLAHMQDADIFMQYSHRCGDYALMKYIPASTLSACAVVASTERPNTQWPREAAEVRRRGAANQTVMQQWLLSMSPHVYATFGPGVAAMEVLPMIPHLTTPALRPVSRHLFSAAERACVDGLIDTMIRLGLKYSMYIEEEDDEDGNEGKEEQQQQMRGTAIKDPPLQFRPPVHRLWRFKRMQSRGNAGEVSSWRTLPMVSRQMVLHEIEMETIRRNDAAKHAVDVTIANDKGDSAAKASAATPGSQGHLPQSQSRPFSSHVPLDLAQRLRENGIVGQGAAQIEKVQRPGTWLDQMKERQHAQRAARAAAASASSGKIGPGQMPVLYKFHEGYTNAVKRPVRMGELLA